MECASCKFDNITPKCYTADIRNCSDCENPISFPSSFKVCSICSKKYEHCSYCGNSISNIVVESLIENLDKIKIKHMAEIKELSEIYAKIKYEKENWPQCEYDQIDLHYQNINNLLMSGQKDFFSVRI